MSKLFQCPAYHKAGVEKANKAIRDQRFYVGIGNHLWLGNGVYFWQEYKDAVWWNGHYKRPVILIVDLICEQNRFLDMDDESVKKAFYDYIADSERAFLKSGLGLRGERDDVLSAGSFNYFKAKFGIELIRYSFPGESGRPQFCATTSKPAKNIRKYNPSDEEFEEILDEYV